MAAVSLFKGINMAVLTSCENQKYFSNYILLNSDAQMRKAFCGQSGQLTLKHIGSQSTLVMK